MTKGTTSQGPRHVKAHTLCRRCGRRSFHRQKKTCASCGFPKKTIRHYVGVNKRVKSVRGQGTGRMKYLKTIPRKFYNGFRCENNYKKALPTKEEKKELTYAKIPRRKLH